MKKYVFIILIISITCVSVFSQTPSTQGKEFFVSFMKNSTGATELTLIITAKRACTGSIKYVYDNTTTSFSVTPGSLTSVIVPLTKSITTASEIVSNTGLIITSTDSISLYASNYKSASFDVTNVLPTHALLDEYMLQTYPPDINGSEFLIIATEDNTIVDITPTAKTYDGKTANTSFSVTLNKGQIYQVITASATGDFSGSIVKARDCKKIAVFNGDVSTRVPSGCTAADHVVEQAFPTAYWGKHFAITNSYNRSTDRVRVTALNNGTKIYRNNVLETTINSGATYEFSITSIDKSCYLETSEPCAVLLYFVGVSCGGSSIGDPSSVWISPIEQKIKEIIFGTFKTTKTDSHYVNVVTSSDGVSSMTLDGSSITSQFTALTGNSDLSFARVPINYGTHTLKNNTGFIAHVYGFGDAESYGYSVGSSAVNLNEQILVNGIQSSQISSSQTYCTNNSITFKPQVDVSYSAISWQFGDGNIATGDNVSYAYKLPGTYTVKMIVQRTSLTCSRLITDTVSVNLKLIQNGKTISDTICAGYTYSKYDFSFFAQKDTVAIKTYLSQSGCDSTIVLNLKVNQPSRSTTTKTICQGDSYSFNGTNYAIPSTYTAHLANAAGCDSTATLILIVNQPNSSTTTKSICQGDSYTFNGITYTTSGTYTANLTNTIGCDSVAVLVLKVNQPTSYTTTKSICQGDLYTFNGTTYTSAGTYSAHLINAVGCDSMVTLILKINQPSSSTTTKTICQGENYSFNGTAYTIAGTYSVHLTNVAGCDSTVMLVLKVNQPSSSTMTKSICQGESYTFNGATYITNGTYTAHLINAVDCDSTASLILKVNQPTSSTIKEAICQGQSYSFNGTSYSTEGSYTVHFTNSVGCDSTAILVLKVNQPTLSTTQVNICQGQSYAFNGTSYTTAGTYLAHLTNVNGCDSTATLILKVNQPTSGVSNVSICQGENYILGGVICTAAGTYIAHISNVAGCDSTVTLHVSVVNTKQTTINEEICGNETYRFENSTLNISGTYKKTLSSSAGCDSIVTLNLTVKPTYEKTHEISLVYGEKDTIDGKVYDQAGTFTYIYTASNGCDSTIVTTVTYVKTHCPKIIVPAYFSPNRDGINDFLEVENLSCYSNSEVNIYDRYGKRVAHYKGKDLGWDGDYLGYPEPSMDYWYVIDIHDIGDRVTGHFILKR